MTLRHFVLIGCICLSLFTAIAAAKAFPQATGEMSLEDARLIYRATVTVAEKSLRLNEVADAQRWLESAPVNLRGWEWNFLRALADESLSSFPGAPATMTAMDIAHDGTMVAVADANGKIALLKLPTMEEIRDVGELSQAVYGVAFSADGRRLASVSRDVTARVWDVETGEQVSQLGLDNPGVAAIAFSPDGTRVATCTWLMRTEGNGRSVHGVVWIWDAATGNVLHKKEVGVKPLDSIDWSADGSTIVVGSWDGLVHVLDAEANEQRTLTVPTDGVYTAVIAVAISPDGKFVAAGSKDRTARIWNIAEGNLLATCGGHDGFVNDVAFSTDGKRLATASVDGTIRTWDAGTGAPLQVMRGHQRSVVELEGWPNASKLLSGSPDGTFRIWDLDADYGARQSQLIRPEGTYTTTFSPDGSRIYCSMHNGHVIVLDAHSAEVIDDWEAHSGSTCNTLALSADGKQLLTCSWDKTAKLWNTSDHSLIASLNAASGVYGCNLSPDGQIAALFAGKEIQLWKTSPAERLGSLQGHASDIRQAAFSSNGKSLVSVAGEREVRIWDVENRECQATLSEHTLGAEAVAISPDGLWLATGGSGEVLLWNLNERRLARRYRVGDRTIYSMSFSPDGQRLAVGSDAITIIAPPWDEAVLRFQPQNDEVYFLSFSPDGRRLASCTTSGSVVINETAALAERLRAQK